MTWSPPCLTPCLCWLWKQQLGVSHKLHSLVCPWAALLGRRPQGGAPPRAGDGQHLGSCSVWGAGAFPGLLLGFPQIILHLEQSNSVLFLPVFELLAGIQEEQFLLELSCCWGAVWASCPNKSKREMFHKKRQRRELKSELSILWIE